MRNSDIVDPVDAPPALPTMNEGLARLPNGAALWHWDTGGEGPSVVFCHPHSGNHCSWYYQAAAFQAAGFRTIAYSRRGFYRSEAGPEDARGTQADDLAALLDHLGVTRAHLVGAAAGGSTALDFVLSYPERTLSAVIASSLMSVAEPDYKAALARAHGDWFDTLPIEARELSPNFRTMDPAGVSRWQDVFRRNGFPGGRPRGQQPIRARIDWETLGRNRVPLLLMIGDADLFLPPALLRAVQPRIGASELAVVADSGHPIFAEQPEAFNRIVLEFLARAG